MAFRNKKESVLRYDPDILVIQECENPENRGVWDEFENYVWCGNNDNKGLGVFTRKGSVSMCRVDTCDLNIFVGFSVLVVECNTEVVGFIEVVGADAEKISVSGVDAQFV